LDEYEKQYFDACVNIQKLRNSRIFNEMDDDFEEIGITFQRMFFSFSISFINIFI